MTSYRATLCGLLAIVLWSMSLGLMRSITSALGPAAGAAFIFTSAFLFVLVLQGKSAWSTYSRPYLLLCGSLFVAYEICLIGAIGMAHTHLQSIELGMINYLWPCLTILLAIPIHKQKTNGAVWLGMLLALGGIILIMSGNGSWSPQALWTNITGNPIPYTMALAAAIIWALYNNLVKKYGRGNRSVAPFLLVTALLLWINLLFQPYQPIVWSTRIIMELIFLGISTATAYTVWNIGIKQGNLMTLTFASYFTPALSAIIACMWLKTLPTPFFWFGLILLICGALLCWLATRKLSRT
ncbi:Aromatic amino acid exporter YddG [Saezia sanguinis]|uniref:Aromatic amino acid exporter YddG n=1 Tax=Saezia sanguinis TaxID=1965230 RepID=A0A433S9M3_9BURK|nr:aromatic amino acid DMT transporter YddG [Saezia sanguinis]RUS65438.1 Aromatic amino acid exporter YddG [Saezia sanguinis]